MFDPKLIEAELLLGLISYEDLPEIAAEGLVQGYSSDALLTLSVCRPDEIDEIQKQFLKFRLESGGGDMSKDDAMRTYAKEISSRILSGKESPLSGAKLICRASRNADLDGFHEVDGFIYAESEMEDRPGDREFFENAIIKEAESWVSAQHDVR